MLSTIQPIGSRPKNAPYIAAAPAICVGMPNTTIAISKAEMSPITAAQCAAMRKNARLPSSTMTGSAAQTVESQGLPSGS